MVPQGFFAQLRRWTWSRRRSSGAKFPYRPGLESLETRLTPALSLGWAYDIGAASNDHGVAIATDATGDVYVTGDFQGTIDFDPGAGTTNLTSNGFLDVFVAKYTAAGALVWARNIGGTGGDLGLGIDLDAANNVYVMGSFAGTSDLDPGAGTASFTSAGGGDIFVVKLDNTGNYVWGAAMGGSSDENARNLAVDPTGYVAVVGGFRGTADFDPGVGVVNYTSAGSNDVFVVKLDTSGNFFWAAQLGGTGDDVGIGVEMDNSANVYITGFFNGTADFDPGAQPAMLTSAGGSDAFVCKLDAAGAYVWSGAVGGSGADVGNAIVVDAATGNVHVTGAFQSVADFDPDPGRTAPLTSLGSDDIFVLKLDNAGNHLWSRGMGSTGSDIGFGIDVDANGVVYSTGRYSATGDFDPGVGTANLVSAGGTDNYVSQLSSSGSYVWAGRTGGSSPDQGNDIVVNGSGAVFYTGHFNGTGDFDPGVGNLQLISAGMIDGFVSRLNPGVPGVTITETGGSTSATEGGATDTYTVVLTTAPSANVTITLTGTSQVTLSTATLNFDAGNWNVAQTVTVTAVNDLIDETSPGSTTITHTSSSADLAYNALTINAVTASVVDNDVAGVNIAESSGTTLITEGASTDTYTVILSSQPTANVTVNLAPDAQVSVGAALVFTSANWNVAQTVTVTAVDDLVVEGAHSGVVTHSVTSTDTFYSGIAAVGVTASITDNDFPPGVVVTPSGGSTAISEGGTTDTYSIVLNSVPLANVTITINTGSQATVSPATTVVFTPANWNVAQIVTVGAVDDSIAEGSHSATVTHTATSTDGNYNGIAVAAVTASITDNDVAGISIMPPAVFVAEGGATGAYGVVLTSQPTANVIVSITTGSQVSVGSTSLVFTPGNWNVAQNVVITAVDDSAVEGAHTGVLTHAVTSSDPTYAGIAAANVTANITDNDSPSVIVTLTSGAITALEGTTGSYTVVLNTAPTQPVIVNVIQDLQVTVAQTALTFTSLNWSTPQPVVLTANDDPAVEGPHQGVVTQSLTTTDPLYAGVSVASVTAQIVDNDGPFVLGTAAADQILVAPSADGSQILVTINGKTVAMSSSIGQLRIEGGAGNDYIQVTNPPVPVVVLGQTGIDKLFIIGRTAVANTFSVVTGDVTVNGIDVNLWDIENLVVGGSSANDTFTMINTPSYPINLKGDLGSDIVIGPNGTNTWAMTTLDNGTLNKSVTLNSIENLRGGSGADNFVFSSGKGVTGQLDGGAGVNTLDYSLYLTPVTVNLQAKTATGTASFLNIGKLLGGRGSDKLIGLDQVSTWNISGKNIGDVAGFSFRAVESLTGGSLDDTFRFADAQGVSGKIDGAGGVDYLDYSSYINKGVAVNLQSKTASNTGGWLNLENFVGGSGTVDSLIGYSLNTNWNFTALGGGTIDAGTVSAVFNGFENFTGGNLADSFTLAAGGDWRGQINGGLGKDLLTAYSGTVNVYTGTINGTLNGRKYVAIETRR